MSLTPADYREALLVQDACNLSGVARSFCGVIARIWEEARSNGEGTDYVNKHPISVLYCDKMASLAGVDTSSFAAYGASYHMCKEVAGDA